MVLGMSLSLFTTIHVIISLIGIASGFIVLIGMFSSKRLDTMTMIFLVTTVLTSITGFMFPFKGVTPGITAIGILSMIALSLLAILARYRFHLAGHWRAAYVISAVVISLYNFNVFVLSRATLRKVPAIHDPRPPLNPEPPFKIAQATLLHPLHRPGLSGREEVPPRTTPRRLNRSRKSPDGEVTGVYFRRIRIAHRGGRQDEFTSQSAHHRTTVVGRRYAARILLDMRVSARPSHRNTSCARMGLQRSRRPQRPTGVT